MYPLLLKAPTKDYLWGGNKLKTDFNLESDTDITAEAWMLSCHKDGSNTVLNGDMKGKSLPEVLKFWGAEALGENAAPFPYFPILIKLIDANNKLSVQVHPSDEYALENEGEFGKTEMWYVVDCKEGAELIYGFLEDISTEEFERRIKDNTLTDVCNFVPVKKGDVFFISAGTLHAIGEGILIAEVQQNSNTTYRVSDYGRLDKDGNPRPLHIEKAVAVTKTQKLTLPYGQIGEVKYVGKSIVRDLAECELFTAKLLTLNENYTIFKKYSFVSLVVIDGNATLIYNNETLKIKKGDSIFIPAIIKVDLIGTAEILMSYV